MKKLFLKYRRASGVVIAGLMLLAMLFFLLVLTTSVNESVLPLPSSLMFDRDPRKVIEVAAEILADGFPSTGVIASLICVLSCTAALSGTVLTICGAISALRGGKFSAPAAFLSAAPVFALAASNSGVRVLGTGAITLCILSILCYALAAVLSLLRDHFIPDAPRGSMNRDAAAAFALSLACLLSLSTIFIVPMFTIGSEGISATPVTTGTFALLASLGNGMNLACFITFLAAFLLFTAAIVIFIRSIRSYFCTADEEEGAVRDHDAVSRARISTVFDLCVTVLFLIGGLILTFFWKRKGLPVTTSAWIPFLICAPLTVLHGYFNARTDTGKVPARSRSLAWRMVGLIFVILFTALPIVTMSLDLIQITVSGAEIGGTLRINGFDVLRETEEIGAALQLVSFLEQIMLTASGLLLLCSIAALLSHSEQYGRISAVSVAVNSCFTFLLGFFGKYYEVAQKINEDALFEVLAAFGLNPSDFDITYKVKSPAFYMVFALGLLGVLLLVVKPLTRAAVEDAADAEALSLMKKRETAGSAAPDLTAGSAGTCPVFDRIDATADALRAETSARRRTAFAPLSLPELVSFVVDYARESRLHLSYTAEDIADFVAGLGATRLTILQGMSGTGKTSLPKIFAEALNARCEIVEVESAWKDKNELLGYYNEFSRIYTPKKFTQALYRAVLDPQVPTFIVLDEMNLSRIEYYFSDFLSLMENEEGKREITLLNTRVCPSGDAAGGDSYLGLLNGHRLNVPSNVYFIGTANRDESTFAISDKVYDRAHTMNFNKRAPKARPLGAPLAPRFVPTDGFRLLIDNALAAFDFDAETHPLIRAVEELLAPYNISFGNRILGQIEAYVRVYCCCFHDRDAVLNDAIEKILLSKVVSKLETKVLRDRDALIHDFEKLGLSACADFIRTLSDDSIYE